MNKKESNGIGTAGFVLAIIALFLGWIPVLGWILWVLGLVFSFVGVTPRGLQYLGLPISIYRAILFLYFSFCTDMECAFRLGSTISTASFFMEGVIYPPNA